MQQTDIHQFLNEFFTEYQCPVTNISATSMVVQLTPEMDKALMNRPFYWHYIEKMGGLPSPMQLTFETSFEETQKSKTSEMVHYGSPRLHQLFSFALKQGKFGHYYEDIHLKTGAIPLKPWICLNGKLTYQCHRKKEHFFSIALSLITGEMLNNFHSLVEHWPMKQTISSLCFPLSPLIKPASGIQRIKNHLLTTLHQENHSWAEEANLKIKEEIRLLEQFYIDVDPKPDSYEREKEAIQTQYDPVIQLNIINGGLFYLNSHPLNTNEKTP
ncbi:YqhG family protein [Salipaludibacillus keqinensis]|nr:YqhG family protein [Salipaludibacillus keqinensis]